MTFSQTGLPRVSLKKLTSDTLIPTMRWSRSRKKSSIAERHWETDFSSSPFYVCITLFAFLNDSDKILSDVKTTSNRVVIYGTNVEGAGIISEQLREYFKQRGVIDSEVLYIRDVTYILNGFFAKIMVDSINLIFLENF